MINAENAVQIQKIRQRVVFKVVAFVIALAAMIVGIVYTIDAFTTEQTPFKTTIEDIEQNGAQGHNYVEITGAYAPGSFVYQYKLGEKKVEYIIYPVISQAKLAAHRAAGGGNKGGNYKASVIAKMEGTVDQYNIDSFSLDKGMITIKGVVHTGMNGMGDEEKALLSKGSLSLADNFIYVVDEKPTSRVWSVGILLFALLVMAVLFPSMAKDSKAIKALMAEPPKK